MNEAEKLDQAQKRNAQLLKELREVNMIIKLLLAAGLVTEEKIEQARALAQSFD